MDSFISAKVGLSQGCSKKQCCIRFAIAFGQLSGVGSLIPAFNSKTNCSSVIPMQENEKING